MTKYILQKTRHCPECNPEELDRNYISMELLPKDKIERLPPPAMGTMAKARQNHFKRLRKEFEKTLAEMTLEDIKNSRPFVNDNAYDRAMKVVD